MLAVFAAHVVAHVVIGGVAEVLVVAAYAFPVVYAALEFGFRGSVATTGLVVVLTLPYVVDDALTGSRADFAGHLTELIVLIIVAPVVGIVVERERAARLAHEVAEVRYRALFAASGVPALVLDEAGRVLATGDDTGSSQLIEIGPGGDITPLTALEGPCTGRYRPGQRAALVSHDEGGNERSQISLLRLPRTAPASAADLEPVLPPIFAQFQKKTGIRAEATYKASAVLTTQILNGAPFDLFLSADLGYPKKLIAASIAESSAPITYAQGSLVLWTRDDSHLPPPSVALLRDPALRALAIANPRQAPYGRAAVSSLKSLKLYQELKPRIVTAENIGQAAQFVESGNADAGLLSYTSALTPTLSSIGSYFVIPRHLYPPIEQGAIVVKKSAHRTAAHKLLDFLLSPQIQAELAKGGLTPVHSR